VLKSIIMFKRIGKNPINLPNDDTAHGLISFYFKLTIIGIFIYVVIFSFFPELYELIVPIKSLEFRNAKIIGIAILIVSLVWTIIAQNQMKNSWRVGIDHDTPTELITNGLFRISRNPIYFGMLCSLIGLLLITPNYITLMFLILGYVFIQIQIRLEEEFLANQHGQEYEIFKQHSRRII